MNTFIFVLILTISTIKAKDAFTTLVTYEAKQRKMAGVN